MLFREIIWHYHSNFSQSAEFSAILDHLDHHVYFTDPSSKDTYGQFLSKTLLYVIYCYWNLKTLEQWPEGSRYWKRISRSGICWRTHIFRTILSPYIVSISFTMDFQYVVIIQLVSTGNRFYFMLAGLFTLMSPPWACAFLVVWWPNFQFLLF